MHIPSAVLPFLQYFSSPLLPLPLQQLTTQRLKCSATLLLLLQLLLHRLLLLLPL
jgi:hypothetical protein